MLSSASQGVKSSQVGCFGQDTTQLRSRPGKRAWRAEVPASDANKADGAAALRWFYHTFPLAALALDKVEQQHVSYLKGLLQPQSGHGRASVLGRLKLVSEAAARRQQLRVLTPNATFALPHCTHFVSYIRGLPHGSCVKLTQSTRVTPFAKGAFTGMCLAACLFMHAHMGCTAIPPAAVAACPNLGHRVVPCAWAQTPTLTLTTTGAPAMSKNNALYFNGGPGPRHILMMDPACEVDYPEGSMLHAADGTFVSMKLPWVERLHQRVQATLFSLASRWGEMVGHIPRGGRKASASCKFFGGGLKGDTDSGLAMFHAPLDGVSHDKHYHNQNEVRGLLKREVLPRVEKYLYTLLDLPRDALRSMGLSSCFLSYFPSIACGWLFWNELHEDTDVWITILVVLGDCQLGGGFAHPTVGWVHKLCAGDILVINPAVLHSTAEVGDALSDRKIIAIYLSANTFRACATSQSVMREHGLCGGRPNPRKRCKSAS